MLQAARRFVRSRLTVISAAGAAALLRACTLTVPENAALDGLSGMLAKSIEGRVQPDDIAWEPSRGAWLDATFGRRALFLGTRQGGLRDVYRARVSVSSEGQPVRVLDVVNLTDTAEADERGLSIVDRHAAYTTVVDDEVTTITSLELAGRFVRSEEGWLERMLLPLVSLREVGSLRGIGRTHYPLGAKGVEVTLEADALRVSPVPPDGQRSGPDGLSNHVAWRQFTPGANLVPAPSALLNWLAPAALVAPVGYGEQVPSIAAESAPSAPSWPPSIAAAEGLATRTEWQPLGESLDASGAVQPALFYHTSVQTVQGEQFHLVAIDLRRVELRMQGGYAAPRGPYGPPGFGRVTASERPRLVAAFNGAGGRAPAAMRVLGRDIAAPEPGRASLVLTDEGRVGLGFWPETVEVPAGISSFRQTSFALVRDGRAASFDGDDVAGQRSALCRDRSGVLSYVWAEAMRWESLASALADLGCEVALALAGQDGWIPEVLEGNALGFSVLERVGDPATGHVVATGMSPCAKQLVDASPRDFFYLLKRDAAPTSNTDKWLVSPGAQPEPAFVPGLFEAHARAGSLQVELFSVDPGRVSWTIVGGAAEPLLKGQPAPKRELTEPEADAAMFAFDLGHTTRATRYGLAFGTRETLSLRNLYATLAASEDGAVQLFDAAQLPAPSDSSVYVQLPQLVSHGQPTPRAVQAGGHRRRGALCVLTSGRLLAAFAEHDSSAPLALLLIERGCDSVVELDRSSQHQAALYRAGTSQPVPKTSETTLLVGVSRPMTHGTFVFGGASALGR